MGAMADIPEGPTEALAGSHELVREPGEGGLPVAHLADDPEHDRKVGEAGR